jgi:hypothetical protein
MYKNIKEKCVIILPGTSFYVTELRATENRGADLIIISVYCQCPKVPSHLQVFTA